MVLPNSMTSVEIPFCGRVNVLPLLTVYLTARDNGGDQELVEAEIVIRPALTTDRRGDPRVDMATGLIARAKSGDVTALDALIRRHERRVCGLALRLLGNIEDAKDVAQEVFLRMFRHLNTIDAARPLEPWLVRVTVNAARDHAKRWRRHDRADGTARDCADPAPSALRRLEAQDERQIVTDGLKTLSESERTVLVLRDVEGLSTREVAEIAGSSETTVRSQISRARVKLKRYRDERRGIDHGL